MCSDLTAVNMSPPWSSSSLVLDLSLFAASCEFLVKSDCENQSSKCIDKFPIYSQTQRGDGAGIYTEAEIAWWEAPRVWQTLHAHEEMTQAEVWGKARNQGDMRRGEKSRETKLVIKKNPRLCERALVKKAVIMTKEKKLEQWLEPTLSHCWTSFIKTPHTHPVMSRMFKLWSHSVSRPTCCHSSEVKVICSHSVCVCVFNPSSSSFLLFSFPFMKNSVKTQGSGRSVLCLSTCVHCGD